MKPIKHNKIWLTKDKYIYRVNIGEHWYLKKFLVLYKYLLVKRSVIDNKLLNEISQIFIDYINSYNSQLSVKKDCENYFFFPVDIRKPNSILNFEKFNDEKNLDDAARKYYLVYLMGIGMQSGIKKEIGKLLYKTRHITISKILNEIPNIKKMVQIEKKEKNKEIRSENDSVLTIFSDFHAEIRNYRQLLSYRGILPPEEDGYEMNEIGNLICESDHLLTMAIWEHQKIKLRYSNPYTRPLHEKDFKKSYISINDFYDFAVNPYIALIQVLNELYKKGKNAYINFEDYKYFICREAPFNVTSVVKKIIDFRSLDQAKRNRIIDLFNARPKSREFSKNKPKSKSDDFLKELSNLIYGIFDYPYVKKNKHYDTFLSYENGKLIISNTKLFEKFAFFINELNTFIQRRYNHFYQQMADYSSLKTIDELFIDAQSDVKYKDTLINFRKKILAKYENIKLDNFYDYIFKEWWNYISKIDPEILLLCYSYILVQYFSSTKHSNKLLNLPEPLINISAYNNKSLIHFIKNVIDSFNKKDNNCFDNLNSLIPTIDNENTSQLNKEINNLLKKKSYWIIKQKISKERNDLLYVYSNGERERKRNTKMMTLVRKMRFQNHLIMDENRTNFPVDCCDGCNAFFKKGEPECHHIVPFEIYGPDNSLNYAFLCKKCHETFTHKTKSESQKQEVIFQLKEKGIIQKKYFEKLIRENQIFAYHLSYLLTEGYIHTIDYMELMKIIKTAKLQVDKLDSLLKKTLPSKKRWNRAMKLVYLYRTKYKRIMETVHEKYPIDNCDSCRKKFKIGEPECHHAIPKRKKGPESPYNYAYLCKMCHKTITHNMLRKRIVYNNLIKHGIITKETLAKMIVNHEITREHLIYLKNEGCITNHQKSELLRLFNTTQQYQSFSTLKMVI